MTVTTTQNGSQMILAIDGRIDTNTSAQLQTEILKAFQGAQTVTLDFQAVAYISSAGLRSLLIGQKTATSKKAVMELINVSASVMTILKTVGFASILTIRN